MTTDTDSPTGREKVDILLMSKRFDFRVFLQVFGGLVLDVMVNGEDWLARV